MPVVARARTALRRTQPSRPITIALNDHIITTNTTVFDYGCGHGTDLRHLAERNITCAGWDPAHAPQHQRLPADVVNIGYVINVIEHAPERVMALRDAWALTRSVLIVTARLTLELPEQGLRPWQDGWLTRLGTFQKYYEQRELQEWIDAVLDTTSVPAAPGMFYVFRDQQQRNAFAAARYQRRTQTIQIQDPNALFTAHESLLTPLIEFVATRGRLPIPEEFPGTESLRSVFRSMKRAWRVVTLLTGETHWQEIRQERLQDLLVWLALARFPVRPTLSALPRASQQDVRAFFSTYRQACAVADELLYTAGNAASVVKACRTSPVGKLTGSALYVHRTALPGLAPILRAYEGCAHALVGSVEDANVIKLHHDEPKVSYLSYPEFERDPHPSLVGSLSVHLQTFRVKYHDFALAKNPPILHRKELFVTKDHPLRETFARLTQQEERANLYDQPKRIGTRSHWTQLLQEQGVALRGHRLIRKNG